MNHRFFSFLFVPVLFFLQAAQNPFCLSTTLNQKTQTPSFALNQGKTTGDLPKIVSLRPYCPIPQHQGKTNACTAWATTYGALTISRAVKLGVTDTAIVQQISHSAPFVFNHLTDPNNKNPCETAVSLLDCLLFLQEKGACLATHFKPIEDCRPKTDSSAWQEAAQFKISNFKPAFRKKDDSTVIILKMQRLLAAKTPVVIALNLTTDAKKLPYGTIFWEPQNKEKIQQESHALVIIGYNQTEQSFELMNSWGMEWGNGGFAKISYRDFIQHTVQAFYLTL